MIGGEGGGELASEPLGVCDFLVGEAGDPDAEDGELGRGIVTVGTITDLLAEALGEMTLFCCSSFCALLKYSSKVLLLKPRKVNTVSAELCLTISAPRTCIDLRLGSYNRVLRGGSLARGVARGVDGIVTGESLLGVGDDGRFVSNCVGSDRAVGKSTLPNSSNNDDGAAILGSETARASSGRGEVI